MLHTKSQGHQPSGSGEEDFCSIGPVVSEEMFENVDGGSTDDRRTPE